MSKRTPPTGFTLIELIAAMAITTLVAGATIMVLTNVTTARRHADRQLDLNEQAHAAITAITAALHNAARPTGDNQVPIEGTDEWLGELPNDRLRLFTTSLRAIRPGEPESDVREVEFFVGPPGDTTDAARADEPSQAPPDQPIPLALYRRSDPTRNETPDGGGVIERITRGIVGLDFRYHDGTTWRDDWPESRSMPLLVEVQVLMFDQDHPTQPMLVHRLVHFPRWPQASGASDGGNAEGGEGS